MTATRSRVTTVELSRFDYYDYLDHNDQTRKTDKSTVNVAEAKRRFSDLLGRVAYAQETITITRRGRPMARLVPVEEPAQKTNELADLKGWLGDNDPFFAIVDRIVADRRRHTPRVLEVAERSQGKKR